MKSNVQTCWNGRISCQYLGRQLVVYVCNIRSEFEVRSLSSNVHVTAVQFTRPFAYSSSTWVVEDHQHCDKDVTRFMPADVDATTAGNWSVAVDHAADERDVMVTTRSARAPYQYVIKSADDPPRMKLTIPGIHLFRSLMLRPQQQNHCLSPITCFQ